MFRVIALLAWPSISETIFGVEDKPFDLSVLAAEAADRFLTRAAEEGFHPEVKFAGELPARGDPERTGQILAALLDNAVRHTPKGRHRDRPRMGARRPGRGERVRHRDWRPSRAPAARVRPLLLVDHVDVHAVAADRLLHKGRRPLWDVLLLVWTTLWFVLIRLGSV